MPNAPEASPEVLALRARLLALANDEFPAAAKTGGYPVRFNHCFLRIVYDNLFGAQWQTVLPKGKAAYKQLNAGQLADAIELGERVIADPETCRVLNDRSLAWRGKSRA